MIKDINGYRVRTSSREGMKYIKVYKKNKINQEFIPNFLTEKELTVIATRMVKEIESA